MGHFSNDWLRNGGTGLATSHNHFKQKCRVSFKKKQFREILFLNPNDILHIEQL